MNTHNTSVDKTQNTPTINQFAAALQAGRDAIKKACDMLCLIVDANPNAYRDIQKEHPEISANLLANLERVGRGVMHEALLFDSSPAAKRIALLPASQQKALYEGTIKVVSVANGKTYVDDKKVTQLSKQEIAVVFTPDNQVRNTDEQLKAIATKPTVVTPSRAAERFVIEGDKITVLANTTFTAAQWEEIGERAFGNALKQLARRK
jgi:uncharacterized protein YejL (UPF0352 family)